MQVDPDLRPVRTDPDKLRQILLNLLSNAIKYTDDGTIARAGARLRTDGFGSTSPTRGSASRPDELGAIFDEFHRADSAAARDAAEPGSA